jgi:hypothetical protein
MIQLTVCGTNSLGVFLVSVKIGQGKSIAG